MNEETREELLFVLGFFGFWKFRKPAVYAYRRHENHCACLLEALNVTTLESSFMHESSFRSSQQGFPCKLTANVSRVRPPTHIAPFFW
jgi:hypothetical protein